MSCHVVWFSFIHGDGKVTRNFLYVSDEVDAFDVILHHGAPGLTYNIGTTFEISVIDLARYLIEKVNRRLVDLSHLCNFTTLPCESSN